MFRKRKPGPLIKEPRYVPVVDGKVDLKLGLYERREDAESNARIAVDMGFGRAASAAPVWIAWEDRI